MRTVKRRNMEQSLVDYQSAVADLDNDTDLYKELLDCWFAEVQFDTNALDNLIAQNQHADAASYVHRIKGAAGSLGAHELFRTAQKVEDILRGKAAENLAANVQLLYDVYKNTNEQFKAIRKSL